ncbi:hypothetical protein A1O7_07235 [Cladophialophora yegresii CBS 114405]|uniref:BTB domain-containing protein n=1 Tax=Cladophialophora yegresii CBS 114405 TaxID=1182544 RepID=W9VXE0_9EURO|nr:uncharacterized protein A1O7_07235 [Cladophialophora yegresii CBS 114405]EXJ56891.1 hypothetical protein A1O7_07235 [Cladophialophora yegresii CBS 114405]
MARRIGTRVNGWYPAGDIVGRSGHFFYDVAAEGDAYISVNSPFQVDATVLVRVSTRALGRTSQYFRSQFSTRWAQGRVFTTSNPLVLEERFTNFVTFLHFCHEGDVVRLSSRVDLKQVGLLCDKYLFVGRLPSWCFESLNARLPKNPPLFGFTAMLPVTTTAVQSLVPNTLLEILQISYLLNLCGIFAKASRAIMWSVTYGEIEKLGPLDVAGISDYAENFRREALRLRRDLVSRLPTVFYPDHHGEGPLGCGKCASATQDQRWHREVITKNINWLREDRRGEPFLQIGSLFGSYVKDMYDLPKRQQGNNTNHLNIDCGRFRVRHLDVTPPETIWQLYQAIGGLCLPCVKSGHFKFQTSCDLHDVDLCFH